MTVDANELEALSVRIARATVDAMMARKRLTDLLAEEQERLERELYAPPKKRGGSGRAEAEGLTQGLS